jgi:hypothetical protein
MNTLIKGLIAIVFSFSSVLAWSDELQRIIADWEVANFTLEGDAQKEAFDSLLGEADALRNNPMASANELLWAGIIESSYAGEIGGLSALGHAKQAKKDFESALNGGDPEVTPAALASLGTLHSKVPGWPIGFGNDKKAKKFFDEAEQAGAASLDFYMMYAEYALSKGMTEKASALLQASEQVAPRPDRQITDAARIAERTVYYERLN